MIKASLNSTRSTIGTANPSVPIDNLQGEINSVSSTLGVINKKVSDAIVSDTVRAPGTLLNVNNTIPAKERTWRDALTDNMTVLKSTPGFGKRLSTEERAKSFAKKCEQTAVNVPFSSPSISSKQESQHQDRWSIEDNTNINPSIVHQPNTNFNFNKPNANAKQTNVQGKDCPGSN